MNDDDLSGIVRSGSQHSVSVSEHTGNAKTPKNIVVSHEEETEARKRAFEQKALAELEAKKALAAALAEHTEHIATDDSPSDANIQNIASDKAAQNRQAIAEGGATTPNVQSVSTDVLDANIQNIGTDKIQANVQNIAADKGIASNVQNVSMDVIAANQQKLDADKGIQDNRQGLPTDAIATNRQNVGGGNVATNTQNISGDKVIAANVQDIAIDGIATNKQALGSSSFSANNQSVGQDTAGLNRQGIDNSPAAAPNLQGLPADEAINNRQTLAGDANTNNRQGIPSNANSTNEQGVPKLAFQGNKQPLPQDHSAANNQALANTPGIGSNNQPIATDAAALNRQAAPEDTPPSPNRQGVDNGKIESHFEQLPSETIERKKVDFPTSSASGSVTQPAAVAVQTSAAKPVAKAAAATRAPVTEAEKQQAKLKREQANDAFHGRLAGIKNNVNALNHRLTDFEDQVHKEDAKLDKGDPDDFEIDLD